MNFSNFEFAHPHWLWALLIPVLIVWQAYRYVPRHLRLQEFADAHLLPHLLINSSAVPTTKTHRFFSFLKTEETLWAVLWCLGILALAGPRWDYEEQEVLRPHARLMILLDLSESMRVQDLPQSRLEQAKQEIEDVVSKPHEIDIGLMVFAGFPHLVTPLSDDYKNLTAFLNELFIDDVKQYSIQGTRLALALEEAKRWLTGSMTSTMPQVLLISDGDFEEADVQNSLTVIKTSHFLLHTLGVGTPEGNFVPVDDKDSAWLKDAKGNTVISRLNESYLQQLATAGQGIYRHADYRSEDTSALLAEVKHRLEEVNPEEKALQKLWHERFYLLVGVMMILILPWFRRHQNGG
jgi:Ca-activated chloride channel homolog